MYLGISHFQYLFFYSTIHLRSKYCTFTPVHLFETLVTCFLVYFVDIMIAKHTLTTSDLQHLKIADKQAYNALRSYFQKIIILHNVYYILLLVH